MDLKIGCEDVYKFITKKDAMGGTHVACMMCLRSRPRCIWKHNIKIDLKEIG
jgi:hypothetical protein